MQTINRQALAERIHANAVAKGFWDDKSLSPQHYLMLVITELSEAVEAHRKNNHACRESYEEKLYKYGEAKRDEYFEDYIKDGVEDELADAYIRLLDMWGAYLNVKVDAFIWRGLSTYMDSIDTFVERAVYHPFTETILHVVDVLCDARSVGLEMAISKALISIEAICQAKDIDLAWHIEEKMRYNESRPRLHGKEY